MGRMGLKKGRVTHYVRTLSDAGLIEVRRVERDFQETGLKGSEDFLCIVRSDAAEDLLKLFRTP